VSLPPMPAVERDCMIPEMASSRRLFAIMRLAAIKAHKGPDSKGCRNGSCSIGASPLHYMQPRLCPLPVNLPGDGVPELSSSGL
jgi:hypothetical protein